MNFLVALLPFRGDILIELAGYISVFTLVFRMILTASDLLKRGGVSRSTETIIDSSLGVLVLGQTIGLPYAK